MNWCQSEIGCEIKKIDFENLNPKEALVKIGEVAKEAKQNNKRTIININNFDKVTSNTEDNQQIIAKLKNFLINCSNKYKCTVIINTEDPNNINEELIDDERLQIIDLGFKDKLQDKATNLFKNKKYKLAIPKYKRIIELISPNDEKALADNYFKLGVCQYYTKEMKSDAVESFQTALSFKYSNDKDRTEIYYMLGLTNKDLDKKNESCDAFNQVLGIYLNNQDLIVKNKKIVCHRLKVIGNAFLINERYLSAIDVYKQLIELTPKENKKELGNYYFKLGVSQYSINEAKAEALDSFQKSLSYRTIPDKTQAETSYMLGNTFKDLGDYKQAKDSYNKSLNIYNKESHCEDISEKISKLINECNDKLIKKNSDNSYFRDDTNTSFDYDFWVNYIP
jgi:tetratricopeptide (TPR) repeat protein